MADEAELEAAEQWELVNTPLGEKWSGRTRYAAAMNFNSSSVAPPSFSLSETE